MAWQALSPLVQLMQQPSLVYSHLQIPTVKLHWQQGMPLHVQQQLQRPSANMRQRFCSVPRATSSSQRQWILQPFEVFSNSTRAARQHTPIGRLRLADLTGLNARDRARERCDRRRTTFQQGGR